MGLPATLVIRVNISLPAVSLRVRGIYRIKPQAGCRIVLRAVSTFLKVDSGFCLRKTVVVLFCGFCVKKTVVLCLIV